MEGGQAREGSALVGGGGGGAVGFWVSGYTRIRILLAPMGAKSRTLLIVVGHLASAPFMGPGYPWRSLVVGLVLVPRWD